MRILSPEILAIGIFFVRTINPVEMLPPMNLSITILLATSIVGARASIRTTGAVGPSRFWVRVLKDLTERWPGRELGPGRERTRPRVEIGPCDFLEQVSGRAGGDSLHPRLVVRWASQGRDDSYCNRYPPLLSPE